MKNDGGSAFPDHIDESAMHITDIPGMTLRDWFAGQALMGMNANPNCSGAFTLFAEEAYKYADAMIAEREK